MPVATIICDKSVLESLTEQEALLFNRYFYTNITPVLVIEVLADLKEAPRSKRLEAEQVVSLLAKKLPIILSIVNADHLYLCQAEIANIGVEEAKVPMKGICIAAQQPKSVQGKDGKGYIYKDSREEESLRRWREGKYTELDALMADRWKLTMKALNLDTLANNLKKEFSNLPKFKSLEEVKEYVEKTIQYVAKNKPILLLLALLEQFYAPAEVRKSVIEKWHSLSRNNNAQSILELLPYSCYILTVELFYKIALSQRLVESSSKSKSHIDLHYLYYLPFCKVFTSKDKFHKKVVPLFLNEDQDFLWGEDVKKDLSMYVTHIDKLTSEAKESYDYKAYPPDIADSGICKLFDKRTKGWRSRALSPIKLDKEKGKKIVAEMMERIKGSQTEKENFEEPEWIAKEIYMTKEELQRTFGLSDEDAQEIIDKENS